MFTNGHAFETQFTALSILIPDFFMLLIAAEEKINLMQSKPYMLSK